MKGQGMRGLMFAAAPRNRGKRSKDYPDARPGSTDARTRANRAHGPERTEQWWVGDMLLGGFRRRADAVRANRGAPVRLFTVGNSRG